MSDDGAKSEPRSRRTTVMGRRRSRVTGEQPNEEAPPEGELVEERAAEPAPSSEEEPALDEGEKTNPRVRADEIAATLSRLTPEPDEPRTNPRIVIEAVSGVPKTPPPPSVVVMSQAQIIGVASSDSDHEELRPREHVAVAPVLRPSQSPPKPRSNPPGRVSIAGPALAAFEAEQAEAARAARTLPDGAALHALGTAPTDPGAEAVRTEPPPVATAVASWPQPTVVTAPMQPSAPALPPAPVLPAAPALPPAPVLPPAPAAVPIDELSAALRADPATVEMELPAGVLDTPDVALDAAVARPLSEPAEAWVDELEDVVVTDPSIDRVEDETSLDLEEDDARRANTPPPPPSEAASKSGSLPRRPPPPPASGATAKPADEDKKRKRARQWWERFFSDDYLLTVPAPDAAQISKQVDFIEASLGLSKGAMVLDVGCGLGLHAIELSRRGHLVVGLDLSLAMITRAAESAQQQGLKINFLHADIREIAFDGAFDAVVCMGTTFGFFDDDANRDVMHRLYQALRPGGRILLDVVNRDYVVRWQPNLVWFEGDGCVCMEESDFNYFNSRLVVKRTVMREDGQQSNSEYSLRAYSLHELGQLTQALGFRVIEVSGQEATRGVFFGNCSTRILLLAERRAPNSRPSVVMPLERTTGEVARPPITGEIPKPPPKPTS
jgi:SAM-dependent methyltransferase